MKKMFTLIAALAVVLVISACTNLVKQDADLAQVEGSLTYRERIALPHDARITVTLSDVSLMDAPAEVVSSQAFMADGKQVPFEFSLNFVKSEIKSGHTYAISARIEVNNKLMFITDTVNPVITDSAATTKLNLVLIKVK
ncbi:YbaY family lipoprotein [uncultured Photobacterium sp.]|uniref:YbaY family lipoprotein n=1 Tax=uncultured Photobacterium sp. TaxID=173973 RepID=UPI002611CB25|nr:YbaY family lipoprotein [uncultured Photobacterium sp.]